MRADGKLLGSIGLLSCLFTGYARRVADKKGSGTLARAGITACTIALVLLAILPTVASGHSLKRSAGLVDARMAPPTSVMLPLYIAAVCLAFTTATVVNSLNTLASLQCDEVVDESLPAAQRLPKGEVLGQMRSAGQLGRAIGPIAATSIYWTAGPTVCCTSASYATSAVSESAYRFTRCRCHGVVCVSGKL